MAPVGIQIVKEHPDQALVDVFLDCIQGNTGLDRLPARQIVAGHLVPHDVDTFVFFPEGIELITDLVEGVGVVAGFRVVVKTIGIVLRCYGLGVRHGAFTDDQRRRPHCPPNLVQQVGRPLGQFRPRRHAHVKDVVDHRRLVGRVVDKLVNLDAIPIAVSSQRNHLHLLRGKLPSHKVLQSLGVTLRQNDLVGIIHGLGLRHGSLGLVVSDLGRVQLRLGGLDRCGRLALGGLGRLVSRRSRLDRLGRRLNVTLGIGYRRISVG